MPRLRPLALMALAALVVAGGTGRVFAQPPQKLPAATASPASRPGPPSRSAKPAGGDSADDEKKENEKGDSEEGKSEESPPKIIERPQKPEEPVDMTALNIRPDEQGRVTFNFQGLPWLPVLSWLAEISELSLDWQELPGDHLNLRTQRSYSLEEARDLINRHLLARGFTLLQHGELLTVANIKKLDPGLVPRVHPDDLAERMPHEFVKVSFPLGWLIAESAAEEFKPMLSPNGKLSPLKAVNRLEAMDAVINLREIAALVQSEQGQPKSEPTQVREFRLRHVRASDVLPKLEAILGLDRNRITGGDVQQQVGQQILQQLQRMQQNQQRNNSQGGGGGDADEPKLVVNERENSILAHAPPDKMQIIAETVTALDVPSQASDHILQNLNRMQVYRLSTLDPEPLVQILRDLGDLSPTSRVQVDKENRSIIVFGSLADHVTVKTLVERLDGSSRNFEVLQLRRLRADDVAGTIQYMLGEEEDDDKQNNRGYYSYYSYRYGGGNNDDASKDARPFRVDADVENNRLLLWANEVELAEVRNLLEKMGEIPAEGSRPETLRVLEFDSAEDAEKLLQRLRTLWPSIEPNRLDILPSPSIDTEDSESTQPKPTAGQPTGDNTESPTPVRHVLRRISHPLAQAVTVQERTAALNDETVDSVPEADLEETHPLDTRLAQVPRPEQGRPPITIQRLPNGRIAIGSPDTAALDRLEELVGELSPPTPDYRIYHLKHPNTWAYGVELILTEFFKQGDDEETVFDPWWGFSRTTPKEKGPKRLSQRRELKIISDDDSRTILVQGATREQYSIIEELITYYDKPTSSDPQAARRIEIFRLKYSEAASIADSIKAVYRDLLSANDPALQNPNQQNKPPTNQGATYMYRGANFGDDEEPPSPVKFKGMLSVGVDEVSNSVIVSAAEALMPDISKLIETLDESARPDVRVQVLQLHPDIDISALKERVSATFQPAPIVTKSSRTSDHSKKRDNGAPPMKTGDSAPPAGSTP